MIMLVQGPRVADYFNSGYCGWIFQAAVSLLWVQCFYFGVISLVVLKYSEILTYNALFSGLQVKFYQATYIPLKFLSCLPLKLLSSTIKKYYIYCVQINSYFKFLSDWKASEFYLKERKSNWAFWIPKSKYSSVFL